MPKRPPPDPGTITGPIIVECYDPATADGKPHVYDKVRFTVTAPTDYPYVTLTAYQDGVAVMRMTESYTTVPNATLDDGVMGLWSQWWDVDEPASCTAQLHWPDGKKSVNGATLSFEVLP